MSHEYVLWIAVAAYAIHMLEEYALNWRGWARQVLKLPVDWSMFYLVNSLVVVLGICCAMVGWRAAWFSLSFPALMLINATLFHVAPVLATRVYSPGVATAVALFYPAAAWCYWGAWKDGSLTGASLLGSTLLGGALMASPIVLLKIKDKPMFAFDSNDG